MAFKPPRSGGTIASLVVSTLLTIGALASLNFASGIPQGVLFLDESRNASSSANFIFDSTSPSTGAGSMALGVGATTGSTAVLVIDGNNATNIAGIRLVDQGAGTSIFRADLAAGSDFHIDTASNIYSGTDFRIGATNRPVRLQANSSAFNTGSPYMIAFDALGQPLKTSFLFSGSIAQSADLIDVFNNSASSTPVFAIGSSGKTAIGEGASTSSAFQLDVAGGAQFTTASTTQINLTEGASTFRQVICSGCTNTPGLIFQDNNINFRIGNSNQLSIGTGGVSTFNLNPAADATYSVGSSPLMYLNGWFSGTVTSTNINMATTSAATATYYVCANAAGDLYKKLTACN